MLLGKPYAGHEDVAVSAVVGCPLLVVVGIAVNPVVVVVVDVDPSLDGD